MTQQARHSVRTSFVPTDPRDPGNDFLLVELDHDRRTERWIILKAVIAFALVGVLVTIRQLFFV